MAWAASASREYNWGVPELPEVETARRLIADQALHRRIVDVNDTDTFVSRPHAPGQIKAALTGRSLTAAHRRGKTMWLETSGADGSPAPGPDLGIHLGMSGSIIVITGGQQAEGGEPHWQGPGRATPSGSGSRWSSPTAGEWCCPTRAGWGGSGSTRTSARWARTR